ncbi:ribonuclease domain-containing protein [Providencia rettgeri]|jgi:guanyl-specific ribonuclease Sa|uniref:ribonuclease domain-containing protein n=1 Tax=Providencia rettgeri TaxID=587 RepID=UPI002360FAAD|nr:ribonuclease domain-containing protein [Providencia rettgeri]MDR2225161.1 ribonuclease [Providencia sp.]
MNKKVISLVLMAILIVLSLYFRGGDIQDKPPTDKSVASEQTITQENAQSKTIDQLTEQQNVVSYMQKYQKLPAFYITKKEARQAGWDAKKGNLCDVLPNRAIGGDRFSNREKSLPIADNRQWFEADINYRCGHRGADRLLYSSDGMIFVTNDHYKSFKQVN